MKERKIGTYKNGYRNEGRWGIWNLKPNQPKKRWLNVIKSDRKTVNMSKDDVRDISSDSLGHGTTLNSQEKNKGERKEKEEEEERVIEIK